MTIDEFLIEIEEIESIAENFRLGLKGFGHEADYAALPGRIERAMDFRVGVDQACIDAKRSLRAIATAFGFNLQTEVQYYGEPIPRQMLADDTVWDRLPPLKPYQVALATEREPRP